MSRRILLRVKFCRVASSFRASLLSLLACKLMAPAAKTKKALEEENAKLKSQLMARDVEFSKYIQY